MDNPYRPSRAGNNGASATGQSRTGFALKVYKWIVAILGVTLYCSTPWRDKHFYYAIANHEGFGTASDSVAVGIAGSVIATGFFFPVAVALIGIGVGRCTRIQLVPRFDRFTYGWGSFATLVLIAMLIIEFGYVTYAMGYSHHVGTLLLSLLYVGFMYLWWCCSLCHRRCKKTGEPWVATEAAS
ncbi:hypothetical protein LOC67_26950 [Stieleria sp. JC731]|uniref:hypothetical protein n=1 Tax=Stieleria sp. JC731 TaxID=2894195 RepID=UPI001E35E7A9|nr:hypothetical protein [Stieleria sp. JC731]MCC9604209.1 hypothetical protein [Stieleria sp. JC731]